jgi:ribosomal protein S5
VNSVKAAFKGLSMLKDPETEMAERRKVIESTPVRRDPRRSPSRR